MAKKKAEPSASKPPHVRWFWIGWADGKGGKSCEPPTTLGRRCARTYRDGYADGRSFADTSA